MVMEIKKQITTLDQMMFEKQVKDDQLILESDIVVVEHLNDLIKRLNGKSNL
jgi:hypothetical protein